MYAMRSVKDNSKPESAVRVWPHGIRMSEIRTGNVNVWNADGKDSRRNIQKCEMRIASAMC